MDLFVGLGPGTEVEKLRAVKSDPLCRGFDNARHVRKERCVAEEPDIPPVARRGRFT